MSNLSVTFRGWGGFVRDLYLLARQGFTNPGSYSKFLTIKKIGRTTKCKTFIEAGTFQGVTAGRCSRIFETVYTIELDPALAKQSAEFLKPMRNVKPIEGDAMDVLPTLLDEENVRDALVFLDGHFSGGVTACGDLPEPAVEELELLSRYRSKINAIIIDDFRSFGVESGFPSKSQLLRAAEEHFAAHGYDLVVQLDQLIIQKGNHLFRVPR